MQDQIITLSESKKQAMSINQTDLQQNNDHNSEKKKSKLILRKKRNNVPLVLNYSYIFKISQSLIINERALKQPLNCTESFMTNIFYFKSIQSLTINQNYISLGLKQTQRNQFPISYYTERFRSFGDKDFYELAQTLQLLDLELQKKLPKAEAIHSQENQRQILRKQLSDVLDQKEGKKYICFYSEPTGDYITMNRIIISKELLLDLGYKIDELCRDFLKYRHVFFEIFDTSFYYEIVKMAHKRLNSMKSNVDQNNKSDKQIENTKALTEVKLSGHIYRVRDQEKGLFEQKFKAEIIFSKPHQLLSIYEVSEIDESVIMGKAPKKMVKDNLAIKEWEESLLLQQRKSLNNLQHNNLEEFFKC